MLACVLAANCWCAAADPPRKQQTAGTSEPVKFAVMADPHL
jgi:hypothetical protein